MHPSAAPIIVIVGPTAGGKTALSIELAERLGGAGECIAADSMQIYRGMDIGTAKPTPAERAAAPHHLIDLIEPQHDGFTVDHWLELANEAIADIRSRGRWPIVVGGTNLYIKALLEGLFDGPEPDAALRESLNAESSESLRAQLASVDPAAANRIHPNDRRRTIRALEVHEKTGRPISEWQQEWDQGRMRPDAILIGLEYPVEIINRRINARVKQMIERGLFEETLALRRRGPLGRQAREALGYKQVLAHLEGELSRDDAIEQIRIHTRRYARQQRTWLRRFRTYPRAMWLTIEDELDHRHVERAIRWIDDFAAADHESTDPCT